MDNKVFLDTLYACDKLDRLDDFSYEFLIDSNINIRDYYTEINKELSLDNTKETINIVISNLIKVLMKLGWNEDVEDYIDLYKGYMLAYLKILDKANEKGLNIINTNYDILLEDGFNRLKRMKLQDGTYRFILDGEVKELSIVEKYNMSYIRIDNDLISCIFIKKGRFERVIADSIDEFIDIMHRIFKDKVSYDLVLYPKVSEDSKLLIYNKYMKKYKTCNKEYIELVDTLFYEVNPFDVNSYNKVYHSEINVINLIDIIFKIWLGNNRCTDMDILKIGELLIKNLENTYNADNIIEESCRVLENKLKIIEYNSSRQYINDLSYRIKQNRNLLAAIKMDDISSIKNINIKDEDLKNKLLNRSISGDVFTFYIVVYKDGSTKVLGSRNNWSEYIMDESVLSVLHCRRS